jgi:hypothetical protein
MTTENKNTTNDDGEKKDAGAGPEQWSIGEKNTPYELNEDNTAKDPLAFRDALMRDDEKRPEIEKDKDLAVHLLGEDVGKFQECLKDIVGKVRFFVVVIAGGVDAPRVFGRTRFSHGREIYELFTTKTRSLSLSL